MTIKELKDEAKQHGWEFQSTVERVKRVRWWRKIHCLQCALTTPLSATGTFNEVIVWKL